MTLLRSLVGRDADSFEETLVNARKKALRDLRFDLGYETNNMLGRCMSADARITKVTRRQLAAIWLHGKTLDQTFRLRESDQDANERIDDLLTDYLRLCEGNVRMLESEYARAIERSFPIASPSFEWAPRLITVGGFKTFTHKWHRVPVEMIDEEEE